MLVNSVFTHKNGNIIWQSIGEDCVPSSVEINPNTNRICIWLGMGWMVFRQIFSLEDFVRDKVAKNAVVSMQGKDTLDSVLVECKKILDKTSQSCYDDGGV